MNTSVRPYLASYISIFFFVTHILRIYCLHVLFLNVCSAKTFNIILPYAQTADKNK